MRSPSDTLYHFAMSTVLEIEQAIATLPPVEYAQLLAWMDARRAAEVDARLEEAVLSGQFDTLAERAERDVDARESLPLEAFLREEH